MSRDPGCIFCKILERKIPSKIIYEDDIVTAFLDVNPQAPTHFLVIPNKHLSEIHNMTENDKGLVGHLFWTAKKIAEERGLDAKGYRLVINNGAGAGQTVFHVHLHVLSGLHFTWPPG